MIELSSLVSLTQIAPRQYRGKFASGPVRFREDGGAWRAINTDLMLSGGVYVPIDTPYRLEISPDGGRRIYPDRQDLSKYVDFQAPSWLAGLPREVGRNYVKVYGNNWTFTLSASKLGVKLDVVFTALPSFTRATFPISVTGYNVQQLLTSGRIQKPVLIDAVGTVRELPWAYQGGELRVNLDFSGLVFPVVLDPTFNVAASADDTRIAAGSVFSSTSANFSGGLDTSSNPQESQARFVSINIPQGSTINSAFLSLVCRISDSSTTVLTNLACEDVDNATQVTSYADFLARVLTAVVAWDNIAAWTAGISYDSPSLVSPIQTVINRVGWVSGNALSAFWKNDGSSTGAARFGASFDDVTYTEPILTITWTEGGVAVQAAYYYRLYGSGRNRG